MSKVGKLPIAVPAGVTINVADGVVTVKGPKGELKQNIGNKVTVEVKGTEIVGNRVDNSRAANAARGR